jgi:hypothetical protein
MISLSSAENSLVIFVTCMNVTVTYVPPLLVLPRSNMNVELLDSPPLSSITACHKAGWIKKELYAKVQIFFLTFFLT